MSSFQLIALAALTLLAIILLLWWAWDLYAEAHRAHHRHTIVDGEPDELLLAALAKHDEAIKEAQDGQD